MSKSAFQIRYPDNQYFAEYLIQHKPKGKKRKMSLCFGIIDVISNAKISPNLKKRYIIAIAATSSVTWWWSEVRSFLAHPTKYTTLSKTGSYKKYKVWHEESLAWIGRPVRYQSFCTKIKSVGVVGMRYKKGQEHAFKVPPTGVASWAEKKWAEEMIIKANLTKLGQVWYNKGELDKTGSGVI
jgi:hypothetical protein